MALTTMYEGKNNSPQTDITSAISAADQIIPVTDISVFPAAPNLATLGNDENAEVIRYNGIDGNTLTGCERGFSGTTAQPWTAATVISRQITKYDLDTLRENVIDLDQRKAEANDVYNKTEVDTALEGKAPLASPALTGNPTAPTQAAGNNSTRIATTAFVRGELNKEILYFYWQTVSVASSAQIMRIPASGTNPAITTNTVVLECTFVNSGGIISDITWTSYEGYITFSGTCIYETRAHIVLGQKGN